MGISPALFFLVLGIALIVAELVVPGLVVIFLGAAALVVAGALGLGVVSGWVAGFTTWFITSLVLVLGLRSAVTRFLPGNVVKQLTDEDLDAFGEVVEVLEPVTPDGGRIRFRGSSWAAQSLQENLPAGAKAKVVARDNLIWIVEPLDGWAALPDPDGEVKENES